MEINAWKTQDIFVCSVVDACRRRPGAPVTHIRAHTPDFIDMFEQDNSNVLLPAAGETRYFHRINIFLRYANVIC